jgi:hypothetical protein
MEKILMIKPKVIAQLEKMSEKELNKHLESLSEDERKEVRTEMYLAAVRHFQDPLHCYAICPFKMSKEQYEQLDKYFAQNQFLFGGQTSNTKIKGII